MPAEEEPDVRASSPRSAAFGWRRWVVSVGVVFALGSFQAAIAALTDVGPGLAFSILLWLLGMPLFMIPLVGSFKWAARRRLGWVLTLLVSFALAAAVGAVVSVVFCALLRHQPRELQRFTPWRAATPWTHSMAAGFGGIWGTAICVLWVLSFAYPFAAEEARQRSHEAEKLQLEAEQLRSAAELSRLRAQLEPHFLLNTLNAIAGLVTQEPREARRLIGCLGDLLRDALRDADEMQTLGEEIAWLRKYAEILESRHAGSLVFHWEIAGGADDILVPRLLLQPLVENAVKHGALRRSGGGRVSVRASVTRPLDGAARLVCTVEDNGPGLPAGAPRSGAFGLRSTRRRIEIKYPDGSLHLDSSSDGTRAVVELPCVAARELRPIAATPGGA
jgi:signal transduction histidine kinase